MIFDSFDSAHTSFQKQKLSQIIYFSTALCGKYCIHRYLKNNNNNKNYNRGCKLILSEYPFILSSASIKRIFSKEHRYASDLSYLIDISMRVIFHSLH